MRVVKCESYIPEWAWGRVVADDDFPDIVIKEGKIGTPRVKIEKCDTFLLPEVGDKVLVSDNGVGFIDGLVWEYRGTVDNEHVCRASDGTLYIWKYIKPVKEEKKGETFTVDIELKADIDCEIYVNGKRISKED